MANVQQANSADHRSTWSQRPIIGLLLDWLEDRYQIAILSGVADTARDCDVNLVCFVGGRLRSPYKFDAQRNVLYGLVSEDNVDGLLILSGAISCDVGLEETQAFCERYRPLPIVSIALALEGIHSVTIDNEKGLRDAITHLIEGHGHRRIAFIRGPEGNPEAELRYSVYRDTLAQHDIPFDPGLVTIGDFQTPTGAEAVDILLDQRAADLDAIVAANDNMAIGALEALQARGIKAPQDVAVVGFDDIEDARAITPPLTTIRQPLHEQGRRATEMLLALLENKKVPDKLSLSTELVIRQSCGCPSHAARQATLEPATLISMDAAANTSVTNILASQQGHILAGMQEMMQSHTHGIDRKEIERLLAAFGDEMSNSASRGVFLSVLTEVLQQASLAGNGIASWQGALSALRRFVHPLLEGDSRALVKAETLWQQGRVLVWEMAERNAAHERLQSKRLAQALEQLSGALISTFNMQELTDVVAFGLPPLGIESCHISLYDGEETPAQWSTLILAYDRRKDNEAKFPQERFQTRQLVPIGTLPQDRRYDVVVEPLYFRDSRLGLVLFEMGPREGDIYERLRAQISSALQGALLFRELEAESKKEREQMLAALERRALQLETAAQVSRAASSILDPEELVRRAVNLIRDRFSLYYVGLFLMDETNDWAVLHAGTGEAGQKMVQERHKLGSDRDSMIGWCVANKQARIALDVGEEPVRFANPLLPETRSELALPLISRDKVIGALTIQSSHESAFSEEDITTLQTMADQLANAIANARLYKALGWEQYLMQSLMDNVPDYVYFKDEESRFIRNSMSHSRLFGVSDPSQLVGKSDFDFFTEELARKAYEDERQIVTTGKPLVNAEEKGTFPDGREEWYLTTKVPLHDQDGNIIGTIGITKDITERKRAEEQARRRAAQATLIYEVGQRVSGKLELDALLSEIVTAVRDAFGYHNVMLMLVDDKAEHLTLQSISGWYADLFPADLRLAVGEGMIGNATLTGETQLSGDVSVDRHYVRKTTEATKSELAVPIKSGETVIGVLDLQSEDLNAFDETDVIVIETLADQVAAAIENARLYEQAQQEIVERKRAEEALEKQARALDAELEQIFFVASHHLQEPLRMVVSYTQLLEQQYRDNLDKNADELIDYAVSGATRIQALINDLLAFSRVGTRQRPLEPVDSGAVVDRALSYLKFLVEQSGAIVTRDLLPTVLADEVQLTQLFQNLIDNAIKYRSDRPLEIHVGAKRDRDRWLFSVRDNGMGIESQYSERIFQIFQRLHGPGEYSGTGIGLAISKKIVERHGGRIWVESDPNKGSTFYFTMPALGQAANVGD